MSLKWVDMFSFKLLMVIYVGSYISQVNAIYLCLCVRISNWADG